MGNCLFCAAYMTGQPLLSPVGDTEHGAELSAVVHFGFL